LPSTGSAERVEAWVRQAVAVLIRGGLVAFPTDTVYGLGADVFNVVAIERLFEAKGRPSARALPVLLADPGSATMVTPMMPSDAEALARKFWPGPLTIVVRRRPEVPQVVGGGGDTIGIRVPDHEVPRAIVRGLGRPITGTSANSSGHDPHRSATDVERDLGRRVDLVIPGVCGAHSTPSTVVDCTQSPPTVLRIGALSLEEIRSVCPDATLGEAHRAS
jgi:L-threonylcarbamoyladenylate synthase